MRDEWFSVKDKLPTQYPDMHSISSSRDVLVMIMNPDGSRYKAIGNYRDIFGGLWYIYQINGYSNRVVAWKPLM